MELQTIFYTIGIISMFLWIVLIAFIIYILVKIEKTAKNFKESFSQKALSVFKEKNVEIASAFGLAAAHFILDKINKKKKKSKKSS